MSQQVEEHGGADLGLAIRQVLLPLVHQRLDEVMVVLRDHLRPANVGEGRLAKVYVLGSLFSSIGIELNF